ncbi:anti-sigma factor [Flavobacterium sp. '19STA2R22 D10 B1']|uniref:anti-sigma factor n=1 Tax=Flavobacterium aerium TaxID=3037261 RepID=UPI00278BFAA3|nr:anti-sigma factor [Flavobacterium sp. '19STA2R22 D10 B1']
METNEYIESGILELYVYGKLTDAENKEIALMAEKNPEIKQEIESIERAMMNLSYSFSPHISAENYNRIKAQLLEKNTKVIDLQPKTNWSQYLGWAAAIILLLGVGYQYYQLNTATNQITTIESEKVHLQENVVALETKNQQKESILGIIRDKNNSVIQLEGQQVAPDAFAKVYWNKSTQVAYVDASQLPEPPAGKVYQVWALKLNPLTPTSVGLLNNFTADNGRMFTVDKVTSAEAFGITLEPEGGSPTPTLEQLYTLGKV